MCIVWLKRGNSVWIAKIDAQQNDCVKRVKDELFALPILVNQISKTKQLKLRVSVVALFLHINSLCSTLRKIFEISRMLRGESFQMTY